MIKNYTEWLNESKDQDFKVTDLFSSLTRNYESTKVFYTDILQFSVDEERRDWGDIRSKAKLEKSRTDQAFYKLVFTLDEKKYLLEVNFNLTYIGKKEKDAPETASEEQLSRLNTTLTGIDIKKISLKATDVDYTTSSPSSSVKKACDKFLVKMLASDIDSLGEEIYSLEQQ